MRADLTIIAAPESGDGAMLYTLDCPHMTTRAHLIDPKASGATAGDAEMAARLCVFCGKPGGWWRCEACVEKTLAEKYGPDWRAAVDGDEPAA